MIKKERLVSMMTDLERYEDLGHNRAANSELGKKQGAQRERDGLKNLLLQHQDEKILNILTASVSNNDESLVESLVEKLTYYVSNTPSIALDEDSKTTIAIQGLLDAMNSEIDMLKKSN